MMAEEELERGLLAIAASASKFCTALLDFSPFPYQGKLLEDPVQNIVVCAVPAGGQVQDHWGEGAVVCVYPCGHCDVHRGGDTKTIFDDV